MTTVLLLIGGLLGSAVVAIPAQAGTGDNYPEPWRSAPIDSYVDSWGYYSRECTSWVAWALHDRNGFEMPRAIGNANNWGPWASSHGYRVDMSPAVGSVAWWSSTHVAWVEAVNGDQVTIEEYNYGYTGRYNRRVINRTSVSGYIHFKDIVAPPPPPPPADWDGDGVSDDQDWSPLVKGPATNHGYPLSVTQVSGDLDGDGKDDAVAISRDGDNSPTLSWLPSTSGASPSLGDPQPLLSLPAPAWNVDGLKWVVGDYNGDGKDDLFAASGSGYGPVVMYVFLSTGSGLSGPTLVKQPPYPGWQWGRLEFFAGDVDGDGKDDIIDVSRNGDNSPGISMLRSTSVGTVAALADPVPLKSMPAPAWNVDGLKWVVGDYNGDGKDDLFAASGSQVSSPAMYIFRSTGTSLSDPTLVKTPNPSAWRWDRLTFMKVNVDGDDKDDILAISRDSNNAPAIHWFQSTSSSTAMSLADPMFLRGQPAPAWNMGHLKWAVGDYNGDGKDDLFAASGYLTGPVAMYLFTTSGASTSPTLNSPVLVKEPNPQYWVWWRLQF